MVVVWTIDKLRECADSQLSDVERTVASSVFQLRERAATVITNRNDGLLNSAGYALAVPGKGQQL